MKRCIGIGGFIFLSFSLPFITKPAMNQKTNSQEGWVIKNDTLVNQKEGEKGECVQTHPDIAKIKNGYVLVWSDLRSGGGVQVFLYGRGSGQEGWIDFGDWNIYLQILDQQLKPTSKVIKVNDDKTIKKQCNPKVAVNSRGEIIVVWEDNRNGNWDIYGQIFNSRGEKIGSNFLISSESTHRHQFLPVVEFIEENKFVVVWKDERKGTHVYGKIYENYQLEGKEFKISEEITSPKHPQITSLPDGFMIVWVGKEKVEGGTVNGVWGVKFNKEGKREGEVFKINDVEKISSVVFPTVKWNRRDKILVVWADSREAPGYLSIFGQFYDTSLTPIGGNFKINEENNVKLRQNRPSVGVNSLGKFFVVWDDKKENYLPTLYVQIYDTNGEKVGKNFKVNQLQIGDSPAANVVPKITGGEENRVVFIWRNLIKNEIKGRIWRDDGFISNEQKVIEEKGIRDDVFPIVKINNKGEYVIAWKERIGKEKRILFQVFNKKNSPIAKEIAVVEDSGKVFPYFYPAINDSGEVVIVWQEGSIGGRIWVRKYSYVENRWCTGKILVEEKYLPMQPVVGLSNDGSFVVVYSVLRHSRKCNSLYGKKFHPCGCVCGEEFLIEDPPPGFRSCESPDISMDKDGNFVVVWHQTKSPSSMDIIPSDIYGQRFNSDAIKIGKNFKINEISQRGQVFPKVVLHKDVGFGVVWMKEKSFSSTPNDRFYCWREVWLQLYDTQGKKSTHNIKLPKIFTLQYATLFPSIALNPILGEYIVVWTDYQQGYPQLKALRINKNGKIIGNEFYVPQDLNQSSIGRGGNVASNGEKVVFVWMDNRREKGWDVYFKVGNFGRKDSLVYSFKKTKLEIIPNPVIKGEGLLYYHKEGENVEAVYIYDKTGRIVHAFPIIRKTPTSIKLKLNHLSSGIYFLKLMLKEGRCFKKFIVIK